MAEYIDREAFKKEIRRLSTHYLNEWDTLGVLAAVDRIPAADVRPVVKARWVYTDMSRLVCSNCGSPVAFALKADGWHHGDYCPNCGADMREGS